MDDRNGECFEHHPDVYNDGAINTSDSEHECLKDFLLEPRDVPCSTDSDRLDNLSGSCLGTQTTTPNELEREGFLGNCTYIVNSCSEREEESEIPSKCKELITSQNSRSSITETSSSETERNGTYLSPLLNNEDLTDLRASLNVDKLRDSESGQFREETERGNSSDLSSVVQTDIARDLRSTKCGDHQVNTRNKLPVVPHQLKVQESTKSESESQDGEAENAHSFESSDTLKGRNAASRGRKRKGAETAARGRPPGPAKKKKQPVTYQSQISPDQNGIKIRIKKSSASPSVVQPPRRRERGRKRKSKKGSNTEDEESDVGSNKQVKWKDPGVSEESEGDEFGEQSDWGLRLPRRALYDIFSLVTQEEGCLPFLIRLHFHYTLIHTKYNVTTKVQDIIHLPICYLKCNVPHSRYQLKMETEFSLRNIFK
jgi:hypothetical protein